MHNEQELLNQLLRATDVKPEPQQKVHTKEELLKLQDTPPHEQVLIADTYKKYLENFKMYDGMCNLLDGIWSNHDNEEEFIKLQNTPPEDTPTKTIYPKSFSELVDAFDTLDDVNDVLIVEDVVHYDTPNKNNCCWPMKDVLDMCDFDTRRKKRLTNPHAVYSVNINLNKKRDGSTLSLIYKMHDAHMISKSAAIEHLKISDVRPEGEMVTNHDKKTVTIDSEKVIKELTMEQLKICDDIANSICSVKSVNIPQDRFNEIHKTTIESIVDEHGNPTHELDEEYKTYEFKFKYKRPLAESPSSCTYSFNSCTTEGAEGQLHKAFPNVTEIISITSSIYEA